MKGVQGGYTILEMLVVLAISAVMFITAVAALGGRQQDIQFSQSVKDFEAKVKDVLNDVSAGYFNNSNDISCTVSAGRPAPDGTSTSPQGTSEDCVFIGKVMHFDTRSARDTDLPKYNVYNVVGLRNNGTLPATSLEESRPTAVAPGSGPNLEDEVQNDQTQWGLRVTRVYQGTGDIHGLAFFTTFSNTIGSGVSETKLSNNESVRFGGIEAIPSVAPDEWPNPADIVPEINRLTDDSTPPSGYDYIDLNSPDPITICLQNAEQTRRASVVIGLDGLTSTTIKFDDYDIGICGP